MCDGMNSIKHFLSNPIKTETNLEMREWLKQLRLQSKNLGQWRRRRNALPNIMVLKNMNDSMVGDH